MNTNKSLTKKRGVKFDDRTSKPGSFTLANKLLSYSVPIASSIASAIPTTSTNTHVAGKVSTFKSFMSDHAKVLKYATAISALCLITNEAYAIDIVATFKDNIVTPIHTLVRDNYGKGIGILAMGYMLMSEGADMRTKATRAGVGVAFGYGLGNLLFGA